jgi:hypothetical protein
MPDRVTSIQVKLRIRDWLLPSLSIWVDYTPVIEGARFSGLDGQVQVRVSEAEEFALRVRRIAEQIGIAAPAHQLDIDGQVVSIPEEIECLELIGSSELSQVYLHFRKVGTSIHGVRVLQSTQITEGQKRLIDSILSSAKQFAWDDLRKKYNVPIKRQDGRRATVFISYRSTKHEFATLLATRLGKEGVVPWFDKWEVLAGDSVPGKLEEGLTESVAMIAILSSDYPKGKWCTEELQAAISKRVETKYRIIPVLLEDCDIPPLIGHLSRVDMRGGNPQTFEAKIGEIVDAINMLEKNPFR